VLQLQSTVQYNTVLNGCFVKRWSKVVRVLPALSIVIAVIRFWHSPQGPRHVAACPGMKSTLK